MPKNPEITGLGDVGLANESVWNRAFVFLLCVTSDGLPLVEDLLEPVARALPPGRLGGDRLRLLDQGGLARQRLAAGHLAGGLGLAGE